MMYISFINLLIRCPRPAQTPLHHQANRSEAFAIHPGGFILCTQNKGNQPGESGMRPPCSGGRTPKVLLYERSRADICPIIMLTRRLITHLTCNYQLPSNIPSSVTIVLSFLHGAMLDVANPHQSTSNLALYESVCSRIIAYQQPFSAIACKTICWQAL